MPSRTNHKKTSAVFVIYTAIAIALSFPSFTLASTYDDYLLATEKVGETLGEGIKGGVEDTKELYQNAWNELTSLSLKTPSVSLPKVGPSLDSYAEYSNHLGQTFADTLTQGMGASQNLSQKIWSTDPYGHLTANITDVWNSTTNYFSNLFKKTTTSAPLPTSTQGGVGTPTVNVVAKPVTPKPTPTPVTQPKITTPQTPKPTKPPPLPLFNPPKSSHSVCFPASLPKILNSRSNNSATNSSQRSAKSQDNRNQTTATTSPPSPSPTRSTSLPTPS